MIPVVLSGGSGTRLWPVSRTTFPKQFCSLFGDSLQKMTLQRLKKINTPWVVTSTQQKVLTEKEMKELQLPLEQIVYETIGRNTAPAIALIAKVLESKKLNHEVIGIFPADHLILNEEQFLSTIRFAEKLALDGKVVTLGIKPTFPETGFGYIQCQPQEFSKSEGLSAHSVIKFHEKPQRAKAEEFIAQGHFSWNAGIFIFKVEIMIQLMKKHEPEIWNLVSTLKSDLSNLEDIYSKVKSISIDYAIMEKLSTEELVCIPSDFGWSDVGSWDAVSEMSQDASRDQSMIQVNSQGNYIYPYRDKTYSFVGVDDLIVVDTADAALIVKKGSSQDVRGVIEKMKLSRAMQLDEHIFQYRPWGRYEILRDEGHFKSKVIKVNPMSQISYQSHAKREEHWIVTEGKGEVVLNDKVIPVERGTHIHIPLGAKHRIRNTQSTSLEFVEVQLGTYFGEDDIVRYEDDYKRV